MKASLATTPGLTVEQARNTSLRDSTMKILRLSLHSKGRDVSGEGDGCLDKLMRWQCGKIMGTASSARRT